MNSHAMPRGGTGATGVVGACVVASVGFGVGGRVGDAVLGAAVGARDVGATVEGGWVAVLGAMVVEPALTGARVVGALVGLRVGASVGASLAPPPRRSRPGATLDPARTVISREASTVGCGVPSLTKTDPYAGTAAMVT
jgi:hypothetical protein